MARRDGQDEEPPRRRSPTHARRPRRAGALVAFRSRDFSVFWGAGMVSNTGTWMQTVTVPFVIDQLTHSTALVGVAAFCAFFPATVIGPLAGSLSDRYDRRSLLIWAQLVLMAVATGLWALWATGAATTALVLGCVVIGGPRRRHHHRGLAGVRAAARATVGAARARCA